MLQSQIADSPGLKTTPGRRRQNRPPSTRSPAMKSYASESDMPSDLPFPIELPNGTGSPFATPQKSGANSPVPTSQLVNTRSKPRNGNKPRAKSGQAPPSPAPARQNRRTPPNTVSVKPPTSTAFAGATFHASPAPSSLPIPSFLAKAMDSPQVKDPGRATQQPSPPLSDTEAPTARRASVLSREVAKEESPLDLFFRADRAEKERARRASSANVLAAAPGPFSPPRTQLDSPPQAQTVPSKPPTILSRRGPLQRNSSAGGISTTELDGTPGGPMGPAFSTPYSERIRAARSNDKQAQQTPSAVQQAPQQRLPPQQPPTAANAERTEALKRFLAVGSPSSSAASQSTSQNNIASATMGQRLFGGPGSGSQQHPSATQPSNVSTSSQLPEIQRMEDNLRRILKLDHGVGS